MKGALKETVVEHIYDIQGYHPDVEIERFGIQTDHVHLAAIIPPRYAVSSIVATIQSNSSRGVRQRFQWVKKVYWRMSSGPGFLPTIGINEEVINRYVGFQERIDKSKLPGQLSFDF